MELKPGYKQTEVGVIPEDWESTTVRELASRVPNAIVGGPFGSDLVSKDYVEEGVPVIRGQNMGFRLLSGNFAFVTPAKAKSLESNLARPGDLVFTQRGTLGQVSLVPDQPFDRYLVSQSQMKFTVNGRAADPVFLYYVFSSSEQQEFIRTNTIQTGVPHINLGILRAIPVQRPSLTEQEAIAEALSDADALVESLEQLIAKKRQIKQGAMQELLTGKRRLPGFEIKPGYKLTGVGMIPEDWNCAQLPALMSQTSHSIKIGPFGSALKRELLTKKGYKVYGQENVYEKNMTVGERFISDEHFRKLKSCEVKPGDFLISMMGTVGKCLVVPINIETGIMDSHLLRLRLDPSKLDAQYLSQLFQTQIISNQVKQLSVGGIMEGLSSKIIKLLQLPVPEIEEQTAIAAILSDMDAEIEAIEAKLAKARQVKQGMMQELLTGRIRLI